VYGKISFHIKEYLEKGITEIGLVWRFKISQSIKEKGKNLCS
jgi:hypothetical protein